jgi:hypothetical protein
MFSLEGGRIEYYPFVLQAKTGAVQYSNRTLSHVPVRHTIRQPFLKPSARTFQDFVRAKVPERNRATFQTVSEEESYEVRPLWLCGGSHLPSINGVLPMVDSKHWGVATRESGGTGRHYEAEASGRSRR